MSCSLNIFTVLSFYFIACLFEPPRSYNEPCHKTEHCARAISCVLKIWKWFWYLGLEVLVTTILHFVYVWPSEIAVNLSLIQPIDCSAFLRWWNLWLGTLHNWWARVFYFNLVSLLSLFSHLYEVKLLTYHFHQYPICTDFLFKLVSKYTTLQQYISNQKEASWNFLSIDTSNYLKYILLSRTVITLKC